METTLTKRVGRKPFIHVDILAELSKVREEQLDQLKGKASYEIDDAQVARLLGRTTTSVKYQVDNIITRITEGQIFSLDEIKIVAQKYALRFGPATRFKGKYPQQAIDELRKAVSVNNIDTVRILAPSKAFEMNYYSDPVMFVRINYSDNWKVIHKWGNDFTIMRRLLSRDYKALYSLFSLVIFIGVVLAGIASWNLNWYYATPITIAAIIIAILAMIHTCVGAFAKNPEPFFYDPNQWDKVDVSTD